MLTFLIIASIALMMLVLGGLVAIPILIISAVLWLLLLPFKILFKLIFGLGGMVLGVIIAPLVMLIVGVVLVGALVAGVLGLLAPLFPLLLLGLFVWAVYRLATRRSGYPTSASGFHS